MNINTFLENLKLDTEEGRKKATLIVVIFVVCLCMSMMVINLIVQSIRNPKEPMVDATETSEMTIVDYENSPTVPVYPTSTIEHKPEITTTPTLGPNCEYVHYESQVKLGDVVKISTVPNLNQRIRIEPDVNKDNVITLVGPGTKLFVLDGPRCSNGWYWWKVKIPSSNTIGWTSEGDEHNYWLIPQ